MSLLSCALVTAADKSYQLHYTFDLSKDKETAIVSIALPKAELVSEIDFNLDTKWHSNVEANGKLKVKDGRAIWNPPKRNAKLTLQAKLNHQRKPGSYDSYSTEDWAIFRGDDMVPPARVRTQAGAYAIATLEFKLPKDWPSVNTGWKEIRQDVFRIDNPNRRFDRPVGWMIAGKLGTRIDRVGTTRISVSAPKGGDFRRMDILTFLNIVWPEVEKAYGNPPPYLLIVGAGNPMWRGGLSAPNSLFIHEDRPIVSENGTSTLIHELSHMVTGIVGAKGHDWIAEGLIEFYSVELLYRAGAMNDSRRGKVYEQLTNWSKDVQTLIRNRSTGKVTARAVILFNELDREIQQRSQYNIDDVTRRLMKVKKASLKDLQTICKELVQAPCKTLNTPLLKQP